MDDPTHYLSPAEIYTIAEDVLGRRPDVRDRHLLRSAAARPKLHAFGQDAYPTLLDKAAALLHALAAYHLFYDGNKRTATRATVRFLNENGLKATWDEDEAYAFILEIAQSQHDVPEVVRWLEQHTEPLNPMRYLTVDELIYINGKLPGNSDILVGTKKVRDIDLLETAWGRPMQTVFGQDAYPTLREKAAALLHSIARNHPFADGNKRTAAVAAIFMLEVNGLRVRWEPAEALSTILAVAEGKLDVAGFAAWLPVEPCDPRPDPDVEADMRAIERIMTTHRWLLDELAKR